MGAAAPHHPRALHQAERSAELAAIRDDLTAIRRRLAGEEEVEV